MRLILLLLTFLAASTCLACSEALVPFDLECKAQDKFNKLASEFSKSNINITQLKGFAIPRILGNLKFFSAKNDFLNHTQPTLNKNVDWQAWKNGQKFIEESTSPFLDYTDIIKLHKVTFSGNLDAGRIRTNFGLTNPKAHFSCEDKVINEEISDLLYRYDVKSSEGYPLLVLENIKPCEDKENYSADLRFYKGASMKTELKSWLADFNDSLIRYSTNDGSADMPSPYAFLADMQRRFIAIHPFSMGNELLANLLIDYAAQRLALPSIAIFQPNSILLNLDQNRLAIKKSVEDNLTFFENCLFEIKVGPISPQCNTL